LPDIDRANTITVKDKAAQRIAAAIHAPVGLIAPSARGTGSRRVPFVHQDNLHPHMLHLARHAPAPGHDERGVASAIGQVTHVVLHPDGRRLPLHRIESLAFVWWLGLWIILAASMPAPQCRTEGLHHGIA